MSRRPPDGPLVLDYSSRKFTDKDIEDRCEHVKKRSRRVGSNGEYRLNFRDVDFSHNQLTSSALVRVVDLCLMCRPCLRVVHLSRNKLDDNAVKPLVALLEQAGSELLQLHLSKNELTEKGAKEIIILAHKQRITVRRREAPLWLALDENKIRHVDDMLDELYDDERVDFCEVESRSCSLKGCKHRDRTIHLPDVHKQNIKSDKDKDVKRKRSRSRSGSQKKRSTSRKKQKKDKKDKKDDDKDGKDGDDSPAKSTPRASESPAPGGGAVATTVSAALQKSPDPLDPLEAMEKLGCLNSLKEKLQKDKEELRMYVIRAKQERSERTSGETDIEEYYQANAGEIIESYTVDEPIGKGVFSSVFKAKDKDGSLVAIKLIRSNPMIRRASAKEVDVYKKLRERGTEKDEEGMKYIMTLYKTSFEYKNHLCMAFPLMLCDMRVATKKYGQGAGLPLTTVALYSSQLLKALRCLRTLNFIHMDFKPDNVLMALDKKKVVLCDFGSAFETRDIVRTDYAQPRFYRAPEVIVGEMYGCEVDMWSCGCTMYEMATGEILFKDGKSNNHILKKFMEVCGGMPVQMATGCQFSDKHFDPLGAFKYFVSGPTGKESPVVMSCKGMKPRTEQEWMECFAKTKPGDTKVPHQALMERLTNLLMKILKLTPADRITPEDALNHPFFAK
eukprot:GEMP01007699.1.p1 GENE.GEMP01007699.1~~GEMP01007699.1.p1  ORF type:complete len:673 (+),score=123.78 GEMP01007699.1:57-2075(+)